MKARRFALLVALLAAALFTVAGCSSSTDSNGNGGDGPADHTTDLGGSLHAPGYTNPLANCVSCHGAALTGGSAGSCYACHSATNHNTTHSGIAHRSGGATTCNSCHGPSNSGGLGPACSSCH